MSDKSPTNYFVVNSVCKTESTFLDLIAGSKLGISKHIARQIDFVQRAIALFDRVLKDTTIIQRLFTYSLNFQNSYIVVNSKCGNNSIEGEKASHYADHQ